MGAAASTIPEGTKEAVRSALLSEHEKLAAAGIPQNEIEEKLKELFSSLSETPRKLEKVPSEASIR